MGWILNGFQQVFTIQNMLISLLGCFLGNLVGVLPGLGPTASVSLLFPFMLKLPPLSILLCLGAVYYGAMYGGSITSVLLNIPGEVASYRLPWMDIRWQNREGPVPHFLFVQ